MSDPVLTGFAGVLVAAVATGVLGGRCVRRPLAGLAAWTAAALALTVALAAQTQGLSGGFGPAAFRVVVVSGLLLAPLWLAWGLVELAAGSEAVSFGMRLVSAALTVVVGVILATDPLTARPFGRSWPLPGLHYQAIALSALDLAQAVAVIGAVAGVGLAAGRARGDRRRLAGAAAVALAVLLAVPLRFPLPARSLYPLLGTLAAALMWFGAARVAGLPAAGRGPAVGDPAAGGGHLAGGGLAAGGHGAWDDPGGRRGPGRGARPPASHPRGAPAAAVGRPGSGGYGGGGYVGGGYGNGRPAAPGHPRRPGDAAAAAAPGARPAPAPAAGAGSAPAAGTAPAAGRPYGRILIFTLLDDKAAEFDRLAEQTAEQVRLFEPGTLVYVIHLVPDAPLQRIFYEIYLDRTAFDSHEAQPYMQRFVTERRPYVLATNVIELRLKYAKVAPLPNPPAAGPGAPQPPRLPYGTRPQLPAAPGGQPPQPPRAADLEPLPAAPRPRGQDPRRLPAAPSAGRRHGGI